MSLTSPDARAVVAAVDRLTTQVRRLADGASTPAVVADDAPTTTADDETLRLMRRESLLVLLTRLQRGRALTEAEAGTLRHHVETEIREANTARAELEQAQAAINRVRALRDPIAEAIEQADYSGNMRRGDLADSVMPVILAALGGTDQPTTEEH